MTSLLLLNHSGDKIDRAWSIKGKRIKNLNHTKKNRRIFADLYADYFADLCADLCIDLFWWPFRWPLCQPILMPFLCRPLCLSIKETAWPFAYGKNMYILFTTCIYIWLTDLYTDFCQPILTTFPCWLYGIFWRRGVVVFFHRFEGKIIRIWVGGQISLTPQQKGVFGLISYYSIGKPALSLIKD